MKTTKPSRLLPLAAGIAIAATVAHAQTPAGPAVAQEAPATSNARVKVDFASPRGRLFRSERVNNLYPADQFQAQLGTDVAFINAQGLHGQIYRVWVSDINFNPKTGQSDPALVGVFDPKTGKYDFDALAPYLEQASRVSDSLLVVMNLQSMVRAGWTPAQTRPVIKTIILELKRRFPKIKYIEAFNEADHNLHQFMKAEDLYRYYVPFYQAVNEVNAELRPAIPLLVGGPNTGSCGSPWTPPGPNNQQWLQKFLDGYAADPDPGKRLDFLSYHAYGYFENQADCKNHRFIRPDPSVLAQQRPRTDEELRKRGLDVNIPSFITEMGPYPGPSYDDKQDPRPDYLRQAAGMASFTYWFMESPKDVPFQWLLRHDTNGRKDQLVAHGPAGQPVQTGIFTPYGNSLVMLSKMKTERVSAVSDGVRAGKGAYVVASADTSGISVMVWNYQLTGTDRVRVDIDLSNLPARLHSKPLRERIFRIDSATSNYFADPNKADLQMVAERTVTGARTLKETAELEPNALQLILIEPRETAAKRRR